MIDLDYAMGQHYKGMATVHARRRARLINRIIQGYRLGLYDLRVCAWLQDVGLDGIDPDTGRLYPTEYPEVEAEDDLPGGEWRTATNPGPGRVGQGLIDLGVDADIFDRDIQQVEDWLPVVAAVDTEGAGEDVLAACEGMF